MIHITISNLKERVFEGDVESTTLPGEVGELTVLKNHVPLITTIKKGVINVLMAEGERYEGDAPLDNARGKRKYFESKGGIFEFTNNEATILL